MCHGNSVYLVFEYVDHDLADLLDNMLQKGQHFTISEVKCLVKQLLEAVSFLHTHWIIHRDIKMSNLLYNNKGELKLADFGLARTYGVPLTEEKAKLLTPTVVTLWYRAPELLWGATQYTTAIDMWSVGCIMGELLTGKPLLPGESELDQISRITRLIGSPNNKIWPGFNELPRAKGITLPVQPYNYLKHKFPNLSRAGLDLLNQMLTYDPRRRITAQEALQHPFFSEPPLPKSTDFMPTFEESQRRRIKGRKRSPEVREEGELRESESELTAEEHKMYSRFARFGERGPSTLNPFKRSRIEHQS
jgi:serine/threonine protein kinase